MRILHIIQSYLPARGGAETHLAQLSERFVADGHQVTVATSNAVHFEYFWRPEAAHVPAGVETVNGVIVRRFAVSHLPLLPKSYHAWRRLLWWQSRLPMVPVRFMTRWAKYTPHVPELWRWLAQTEERFDVVLGANVGYEGFLTAAQQFAQRRQIPFVTIAFAHLGSGAAPGGDALSSFYTMRHQTALICESDLFLAETVTEGEFYVKQGLPVEKLVLAGSGIEPRELEGGDATVWRAEHKVERPVITFLGTMSFDKGAVHLLQAAEQLWNKGELFKLVLAGKVTDEIRPWLAKYGGAPWLLIRELISEEEKRNLLAATDIFAMPSRVESYGIVFLEAWVYGVPVIGARTWGVNDVIRDGVDGVLLPFGDVGALVAVLEHWLGDPAERERLGENGRRKVYAEHTWGHKYGIVREAYGRLLEEG